MYVFISHQKYKILCLFLHYIKFYIEFVGNINDIVEHKSAVITKIMHARKENVLNFAL